MVLIRKERVDVLRIKSRSFFLILICALLIIVSLAGGVFAFAQSDISSENTSSVRQKLSKITQNKFGEPVVKKTVDFNGKKLLIAEDNKYVYKVTDKGEIVTIIAKDYDAIVKLKDTVSKDKITPIAEKLLSQYARKSSEGKYILVDYKYKDTENEKYHQFIFNEIAPNGIKTGEGVSIDINNAGDLTLLAIHEGNINVAMETKPNLSREDAVKISTDFIKSNIIFKDVASFPMDISELSVWKDRLVWTVKIDNIKAAGSTYGFDFKIDAVNGEILFSDYYCVIG